MDRPDNTQFALEVIIECVVVFGSCVRSFSVQIFGKDIVLLTCAAISDSIYKALMLHFGCRELLLIRVQYKYVRRLSKSGIS